MTNPVVAKIWWDAPHEGAFERFMCEGDVVSFGRGSECAVRIGHAPIYLSQVPRQWGEISWHRGLLHIQNLSQRWGLSLVGGSEPIQHTRVDIPPGGGGSSPEAFFRILAKAPEAEFAIVVQTSPRQRQGVPDGEDPPSFVPFGLTPTQRMIGTAVIAPLVAGNARRASYADIARDTQYALRTVREAVAAMDGLFVVHRLVEIGPSDGDALDRVAHVLRAHPTLLGAKAI